MPHHTENTLLGNTYATVLNYENKEHFDELVKAKGYNPETVFGIVHSDQTNEQIALLKEYRYYIMLGGKTVSNLSFANM